MNVYVAWEDENDIEMDEDAPDFDDIMQGHNLFELVPPLDGTEGQGPSSSSAGPSNLNSIQQRILRPPALNDDEDLRVVDELDAEFAGKVVRTYKLLNFYILSHYLKCYYLNELICWSYL